MLEDHITIQTPDGDMPVFIAMPEEVAPCPAVILYMDIFGPREELFDFCRRFAKNGFAAILPQLFHRLGSPVFPPANKPDDDVEPAAKIAAIGTTVSMGVTDTQAIIAALDNDLLGAPVSGIGVIGYCMGGRHALAAAAQYTDRIGCGLSIHGSQLVDETGSSPHLFIQQLRAPFYFAFAADDPTCPDEHQAIIEAEADAAGEHVICERFDAAHGWSFPARWRYDPAAAEANWRTAVDMFTAHLIAHEENVEVPDQA